MLYSFDFQFIINLVLANLIDFPLTASFGRAYVDQFLGKVWMNWNFIYLKWLNLTKKRLNSRLILNLPIFTLAIFILSC